VQRLFSSVNKNDSGLFITDRWRSYEKMFEEKSGMAQNTLRVSLTL
jgi:IS1 family transposase